MTKKSITELYDELYKLFQEGDEKKTLQFLIDNFNDLPEGVQAEVATYLFEKALAAKIAEQDFIREASDTYSVLEKLRSVLKGGKYDDNVP